MTPARFQTIEEIFLAALDQEPDQVSTFLDTACEGDAALRREVEALLASDQRAGRFIERSTVGLTTKIIENRQAERHEFHELTQIDSLVSASHMKIRDNSCNSCRRPLHSWQLV